MATIVSKASYRQDGGENGRRSASVVATGAVVLLKEDERPMLAVTVSKQLFGSPRVCTDVLEEIVLSVVFQTNEYMIQATHTRQRDVDRAPRKSLNPDLPPLMDSKPFGMLSKTCWYISFSIRR